MAISMSILILIAYIHHARTQHEEGKARALARERCLLFRQPRAIQYPHPDRNELPRFCTQRHNNIYTYNTHHILRVSRLYIPYRRSRRHLRSPLVST